MGETLSTSRAIKKTGHGSFRAGLCHFFGETVDDAGQFLPLLGAGFGHELNEGFLQGRNLAAKDFANIGGHGFLPGEPQVFLPMAATQPILIDSKNAANVCDCSIAGNSITFFNHPNIILRYSEFFAKFRLRKTEFKTESFYSLIQFITSMCDKYNARI